MDISARARLHEVYLTEEEMDQYYESGDVSVFDEHETPEWKRGDVLAVKGKWGYRNDWKAMWDGEKTIEIGYEFADYGHVAKEFVVGKEFHALYWEDVIDYNRVVYATFREYEIVQSINNGKIILLNGEKWAVMGTNEEMFDEVNLYIYPYEYENIWEKSLKLERDYGIPRERILWGMSDEENASEQDEIDSNLQNNNEIGLLAWFKSDIYVEFNEDGEIDDEYLEAGYNEDGWNEQKEEEFCRWLKNSIPEGMEITSHQQENEGDGEIVVDMVVRGGSRNEIDKWLSSLDGFVKISF